MLMSQVVEPDLGYLHLGEQSYEHLREVIGVKWRPVGLAEYEARIVRPDAVQQMGFELPLPPRSQYDHGSSVEVDGSSAVGGLHVRDCYLVLGSEHSLRH